MHFIMCTSYKPGTGQRTHTGYPKVIRVKINGGRVLSEAVKQGKQVVELHVCYMHVAATSKAFVLVKLPPRTPHTPFPPEYTTEATKK